MKHALTKPLACGTIGDYCLLRCIACVSDVIAAAREVVDIEFERQRQQQEALADGAANFTPPTAPFSGA